MPNTSFLEEYRNLIKNCNLCYNRNKPDTGLMQLKIKNESINDVNIMLVGLSPKTDEMGNFYMGEGIKQFFNKISFSNNFCFDNIIKCSLNSRDIIRDNLKCVKYLLMEISEIKPRNIILLGSYSILSKVKSKYIDLENETILGIKFYRFKHFSYFLYNKNKLEEENYYFDLRLKILELEGFDAF